MGCQDKIEDQESLNVFIQSLYDSERLNVSYSKEAYARITDFFQMKPTKTSYPIPTLKDTTSLVSKYDKFTKMIHESDDEMIM